MGNATLSFRFTSSTGKGRKARVNAKERSVSPGRSWAILNDPERFTMILSDAERLLTMRVPPCLPLKGNIGDKSGINWQPIGGPFLTAHRQPSPVIINQAARTWHRDPLRSTTIHYDPLRCCMIRVHDVRFTGMPSAGL